MLDRDQILTALDGYDLEKAKIGVLASHSALDVCDGAVEEGFGTVTICEAGREEPYARYFKAQRDSEGNVVRGMVDEAIVLKKFRELMDLAHLGWLKDQSVLFIPNRSFVSYCGIDAVESEFTVPMVGSRNLLRTEERTEEQDYYWMLKKVGLPYPREVETAGDIDGLVIVKLPHKVKRLERGFFTAASFDEYREKVDILLRQGVIAQADLAKARIEEYVVGPVFNFDFFYSPIEKEGEKLELLGIDWRFESSLDGHVRLPAPQQMTLLEEQRWPEYTVVGHNTATLRESLLRKVFPLAERYVKGTQEFYPPGMIGPFTLQTCVDKDMNFYIYDVSPRIGGGTNVHMSVGHPYGNSVWRAPMSTGRRLAMEVRRAIEWGEVEQLVT